MTSDSDRVAERTMMVARQLEARGISDPRVLAAMGMVPRHRFVPDSHAESAYDDGPLPIGQGQTISQPYMVASMTAELALTGSERVLEIGTGSGYQAAVLAQLGAQVVSLERHRELAESARAVLAELGYGRVRVEVTDGTLGWPAGGPYAAILVTAGAPAAPRALLNQLTEGGRLVIPVGDIHTQVVEIHTRTGPEDWSVRSSTACRFVPLVGEQGWDR